ncbi:MAG: TonB-dependent receptor [Terracidiphilus sp.]|nr:TonB-dependent receptor [Terracidiphilus sp.]
MKHLSCSSHSPGRLVWRCLLLGLLVLAVAGPVHAQSTFGAILGMVRDATGAVIQNAQVTLQNTGTQTTLVAMVDESGNYAFRNLDVGSYKLTIAAPGFETAALPQIALAARETRRIDATLRPGAQTQTVEVREDAEPVITTDASNLAETKLGDELVNLPVAIYSRSTGSTSPISTLTTESGVQTDDSGELAVMGATPALLSITIDGISSVGVEYSGPVNEMFPSFNSIEEIRVSEADNSAEFSGVADITTVSKAGTIRYHGGLFENNENTVFNSNNPFALSKPRIIMNDFGGTMGGPLRIPIIASNSNRTFFFASYEGLRLPRETPMLLSVPSAAMRTGDLTAYYGSATPVRVTPTPIAAAVLKYLFPVPNYGAADSYANNYQINFPSPISANQGDIRLDCTLSSRQSIFARFSYKNRQVLTAPSAACTYAYCAEAGSPLQGAYNTPEIDEGLTFAHNFIFNQNLLNEFRGGFNIQHTSETQKYATSQLLAETGFASVVPQPDTQWSEAPQVLINGFMSTGAGNPGMQRGQIFQLLDNVTWTRHAHTFKFGGEFERLTDHDDNVYGNYRSGWYVFNGSSDVGQSIGDPYTAFLLGYPDYTEVSSTNNSTMDGLGYSWAVFAQDDWKVSRNLTLNLGLRYESHPPIHDTHWNTATFMPNWSGIGSDGVTKVNGAVVVPNAQASKNASQAFRDGIAPTPILTAAQAGIPESLRFTDHTDFGPRLGFAWRPLGNDRTVLRGGWGRFIETPLGFSLVAGWAVAASYVPTYNQGYDSSGVTPLLSLANPFNPATAATGGFYYAFPVHYVDPTVQQWSLTFEQNMGQSIGLRLSYSGSHGQDLEAMEDLNQVHPNTVGYDTASASLPYPNWSVIQSVENASFSNYQSGTVEISRHSEKSLSFDLSYMFTRDLSNAGGVAPTAFAVSGGSFLTDRFNPGLDYGNVIYDRRQRFLATYLYNLPFGSGQRWLTKSSAARALAGNWQLAGVTVFQSGPFLTPSEQSTDPAGTNILTTVGMTRTDIKPGGRIYAAHRTTSNWLDQPCSDSACTTGDPNSGFSIPAANRGHFGNAPVGGVVGPGTANFSLSLMKAVTLNEQTSFRFSVEAANVFNHRNYEPPNMQVDSGGFGSITGLQTAEGAGPRSLELTGRFSF